MQALLTDLVREEIRRYRLAFVCEECRHFVEPEETCDLLYPTEPHRRATYESAPAGERLVFCKMFESA